MVVAGLNRHSSSRAAQSAHRPRTRAAPTVSAASEGESRQHSRPAEESAGSHGWIRLLPFGAHSRGANDQETGALVGGSRRKPACVEAGEAVRRRSISDDRLRDCTNPVPAAAIDPLARRGEDAPGAEDAQPGRNASPPRCRRLECRRAGCAATGNSQMRRAQLRQARTAISIVQPKPAYPSPALAGG